MTPHGVQSAPADGQLWGLVAAMCDGTIAPADLARLESLLRSDENARLFYAAYMDLHGRLLWRFRGGEVELPHQLEHQPMELPHQLDAASPEPLIPPIIIDSSPTIHYPLSTIGSSLGGWLLSYAVATVLTARQSSAPGSTRCPTIMQSPGRRRR